ncbi:MAG: sugar ABC transporter ATP-binding protein [Chloroflexi bacterium]|nr:sugar ABC transporter ATP-binding protein [Chloroflexota bacterium]
MTTAAPAAVVLDVREVSKHFAGVLALDRVSMELRPGEVHALVGENGAGKSTLIKVLTGVHQPDEGEVRYGGEPVSFARPLDAQAAGIATIYQEVNLVPLLSVARNLLLGREPTNALGLIDQRRMNRIARETLAPYGIDVDVRRPLRQLGLGIQQMVAIARAIAADHRVVIMDEPTSSLEPREVERLMQVVDRLRRDGVAVVYVSHRLDEVFRLCDRVTVLRDGRRVHSGPVAEITRLELVSKMLGRDLADVARARTRFNEHSTDRAAEPVLRASDLTRRHVLDHVSVEIRAGEVIGLAGLLGSGRTETVKAIYGVLPLDSGAVEVGGGRVRAGSPRSAIAAGVALIPEDRKAEGIIPTLSVRDNIVLAALPRLSQAGFTSDRRQDAVVERLMSRLRIKASSPDQRVGELSGGNQQKVLLARMLCLDPRVLLLDDPTRGIDVGAKAEIQALISELADQGMGVLLISSELEEVVEGSDRVVVLRDGAVVGELRGDEATEDGVMALIAAAARETGQTELIDETAASPDGPDDGD